MVFDTLAQFDKLAQMSDPESLRNIRDSLEESYINKDIIVNVTNGL